MLSLKGNPVGFRDGPAAVTGNEHSILVTDFLNWEGAVSRLIRESEDLPGMNYGLSSEDRGYL